MGRNTTDVAFIAGMKGPALKPAEADKLLRTYLASEAQLSKLVRRWITAPKPAKLKDPLIQTVLAYDKRKPLEVEKDGQEFISLVADLVDELKDRSEGLNEIESVLLGQIRLAEKGSDASKQANQCLRFLQEARAKPDNTIKQVQVPRSGGKPDILSKQIYDATSAAIAALIMLDVVSKGLKKWLT